MMWVGVDLRNIMPDIKCPTLLIWGECDDDTPLENAKLMESLIKEYGTIFKHRDRQ